MKTEIVAFCDRIPKEPYYRPHAFHASLSKFGVTPTIVGWGQPFKSLMTKERTYRKWLREGRAQSDLVIICDCWDILFQRHPDDIADLFPAFGADIVFNAEVNCFPRGDLAQRFPETGTPWRFFNGGFMVGKPSSLLTFLEAMNLDAIPDDYQKPDGGWVHFNDQEYLTLTFLEQPVKTVLDSQGVMAHTLHGTTVNDYDMTGPRIRIKLNGSEPVVLHFNGNGKNEVMPIMMAKLGI